VLLSELFAPLALLQPLRWCCVDCVIHHKWDVLKNNTIIHVVRASNSKRDCDVVALPILTCERLNMRTSVREERLRAWSLLLLAATVRSFAHMPLGISDRNSVSSWLRACPSVSGPGTMYLLDPSLIAPEPVTQTLSCELNLIEILQLWIFSQTFTHCCTYLQRCQSQQQQMNVHFQRFRGCYPIYAAHRKFSIGGALGLCGGAWHCKNWQNLNWFIVFHVSIRGGLELCLGELSTRGDGTGSTMGQN